ncbi:AraC family transcriptional regulator N-terminal domain-containing protein [Streptomyces sp. NPDC047813]|uniref:AraC family transcriptional regulator n=1 Tax=Streptomyces sp. NPDC047813 TaxID=3154608 RepID=UPI0033E6A9D3
MDPHPSAPRQDGAEPEPPLEALTRLAVEIESDPARLTALPEVKIYVETAPTEPVPVLFRPVLYVVLQGQKQLLIDDRTVRYNASQLVVVTVNLPLLAQVLQADPQRPYVAVGIPLDLSVLTQLARELHMPPPPARPTETVSVHPAPASLYGPLRRLLELSGDRRAAQLFQADALREIVYHVLVSPQGNALRQRVGPHHAVSRVAVITDLMAQHVEDPLSMEDLAEAAGMSATSLHRHFKAATGTTPLGYYKRLRLHEARRLNGSGSLNISETAAAVGYASAAHFSRDYKGMFGCAPSHDSFRARGTGGTEGQRGASPA